jgi:HEAT repeat protein
MRRDLSLEDWADLLREAAGRAKNAPSVQTRVRGAVKTRGSVSSSRISDSLAEVIERFMSQPATVRLEVVQALVQKADELAMAVLRALAVEYRDPDTNVRWTIAEGLGRIANSEAVRLLEMIARSDPDAILSHMRVTCKLPSSPT